MEAAILHIFCRYNVCIPSCVLHGVVIQKAKGEHGNFNVSSGKEGCEITGKQIKFRNRNYNYLLRYASQRDIMILH